MSCLVLCFDSQPYIPAERNSHASVQALLCMFHCFQFSQAWRVSEKACSLSVRSRSSRLSPLSQPFYVPAPVPGMFDDYSHVVPQAYPHVPPNMHVLMEDFSWLGLRMTILWMPRDFEDGFSLCKRPSLQHAMPVVCTKAKAKSEDLGGLPCLLRPFQPSCSMRLNKFLFMAKFYMRFQSARKRTELIFDFI